MRALPRPAAAHAAKETAFRLVQDTVHSPGQALDAAARAYFEPRFGYDFSRVRVHVDPRAAESATSLHALAYTANRHVVLGPGAPSPGSSRGRELLAHELAHVVQQSSRPAGLFAGMVASLNVRPAGDPFEREANQAAARTLSLSKPPAAALRALKGAESGPIVIQRYVPPPDLDPLDEPAFDFQPRRRRTSWYPRGSAAERSRTAEAVAKAGVPPAKEIADLILDGGYKDSGDYTYDPKDDNSFQFKDPDLQHALGYYMLVWAPGVPVIGAKEGHVSDSHAKPIADHPPWVKEFTVRIMGQQALPSPGERGPAIKSNLPPQFNRDSRIAQRLIEAYLRAWHRKITLEDAKDRGRQPLRPEGGDKIRLVDPYAINANLAELYANVGSSITNDRAELFGGIRDAGNWCGPASQNAIALGLMRAGYRFKQRPEAGTAPAIAGKPNSYNLTLARPVAVPGGREKRAPTEKEIAIAFQIEVRKQGAFFLSSWHPGKDLRGKPKGVDYSPRGTSGKEAATAKLYPGDFIYMINGNDGSPLSGHVATVIREVPKEELGKGKKYKGGTVLSKLYVISGNAKGAMPFEGSIRPEEIQREMPHKNYDYYPTADLGNVFDRLRAAEKRARSKGNKFDNGFAQERLKLNSAIGKLRTKFPKSGDEARRLQAIDELLKKKGLVAFFMESVRKLQQDPRHAVDERLVELYNLTQQSPANYQAIVEQWRREVLPDLLVAEKATTEYVAKRVEYNQPYTTKFDIDPTFNARNQREKGDEDTGRYKPLIADHSWVVSIVRSSQLDPTLMQREVSEQLAFQRGYTPVLSGSSLRDYEGATFADVVKAARRRELIENTVLDRHGLERMPGTIDELWPGALDYWEARGAFK